MKSKRFIFILVGIIVVLFLAIFLLNQYGKKDTADLPITLLDHEENEVTFPLEKPTLFFFLTTYT